MNNEYKDLLVPSRLNTAIEASINKARKDKKRKIIKARVFKYSSIAASLLLVFAIGTSLLPSATNSLRPGQPKTELSNIFMYHRDSGIRTAAENGFGQNINQSVIDNGIKFTIDDVMADSKRVVLSYTLSVESGYEELQNLLIKDFTIKNPDGKVISTSEGGTRGTAKGSNLLPENKEDSLNNLSNTNYIFAFASPKTSNFDVIILSPDEANKDFKFTRKSYGTIELFKNRNFETAIPEMIELQFTKLKENNYLTQSSEDPKVFTHQESINKYSREAIEINGNWNFSIKLDDSLRNTPSIHYGNIPFKIQDKEFKIENIDISPLRTDIEISYTDKEFEPLSIMAHLEDEQGNKYYQTRGGGKPLLELLAFESCYFDKSESLYLVIDRMNYQIHYNRKDIKPIENIRVKLK